MNWAATNKERQRKVKNGGNIVVGNVSAWTVRRRGWRGTREMAVKRYVRILACL
jgi:hypothetical protein